MGRGWNRVKSVVYSRLHWIAEAWSAWGGSRGDEIPQPALAQLRRSLARARVAVVTTAGVHVDDQEPFDMHARDGDASYRIIPGDVALARLTITHDYYDHHAADRDLNCVFPLERLREFVDEGMIGGLGPRHVGMMGHIMGSERRRLVADTAPAIAELLRDDGVDLVLGTPG